MCSTIPPAEISIDGRLVRSLLRSQHPDLADLPLRRIGTGWDNEVFRLGRDLTVRLPRRALGAQLIQTELAWLPSLAPQLPLTVPEPVRSGRPQGDYPWQWSVCRHVPGRPVGAAAVTGPAGIRAAGQLAGFLAALHVPAPSTAPRNPLRGVPLRDRAARFDEVLPVLPHALRRDVARAWHRALEAPVHEGPDTWVHGDLHGLNVLAARGRITGVLDFGDLGAGDPATDLACAWLLLDGPGRARLRASLEAADALWERGRGWALYLGLMFLAHSAESGVNGAIGERALAEAMD